MVGLVAAWPLAFLWRQCVSTDGVYRAVGNDFISLYYKYKLYLLASLAEGRFPSWSPSEAAGYPFATSPFSQAFYPLNLLLLPFYRLAGGYDPIDHQRFTVLGVSIFAAGAYLWLRQLNRNRRAVVFSVLVLSVSFKVTELVRFPNAVHSLAWYPWVLLGLTLVALAAERRSAVRGGLLLGASLVLLVTAAYPYFVYYGLFMFPPYLVVMLVPALRRRALTPAPAAWRSVSIGLGVAGVISAPICVPYVLAMRRLLRQTVDRGGTSLEFSTVHLFGPWDTLGSLVYPPAAYSEGWYFFSILGLVLLVVGLWLVRAPNLARAAPLEAAAGRVDRRLILLLLAWLGIVTAISYGRISPLFLALWKFMPGFSSLRVWGRVSVLLVPLIAWLLSYAYAAFEAHLAERASPRARRRLSWGLTGVCVLVAVVQWEVRRTGQLAGTWPTFFPHVANYEFAFVVRGALSSLGLVAVALVASRRGLGRLGLTLVFGALVGLAAHELRPVATRMYTHPARSLEARIRPDLEAYRRESFSTPRVALPRTVGFTPEFAVGVIPNWYFARYVAFLKTTRDEPEAQRAVLGVNRAQKVFFAAGSEHATLRGFLADADRFQPGELVSYSGDELVWRVAAPQPGFLCFIDNWDPDWEAWVDGEPAPVLLLLGTFKAVPVPAGQREVRLRHRLRLW